MRLTSSTTSACRWSQRACASSKADPFGNLAQASRAAVSAAKAALTWAARGEVSNAGLSKQRSGSMVAAISAWVGFLGLLLFRSTMALAIRSTMALAARVGMRQSPFDFALDDFR